MKRARRLKVINDRDKAQDQGSPESGDIFSVLRKVSAFGQARLDARENYLIFGDNLKVLKIMDRDPGISGRVRLVYIDPPFATNQEFKIGNGRTAHISSGANDVTAYDDIRTGKEYIEFLRERLELLRNILSPDGSIYVHIDYKVGHYVKVLMDEIFGAERFISDITRIKCNPKNFKRMAYGNIKDMILFYSKSEDYVWNEPTQKLTEEDITRLFKKVEKDGRRYTTTPIHAPGETKNGATGNLWKDMEPPPGRHWRVSPKELDRLDKRGLIEWSSTGNPRKKIYADEVMKNGKKLQDIWDFKDPPYPSYPTEKNILVLKTIIQASSDENDLVLDCFAGSGTTLVAAEELNRRWIGIDQSPQAINIIKQRLRSVMNCGLYSIWELEK
jgi:adenine-specific DNA-methyltransferase